MKRKMKGKVMSSNEFEIENGVLKKYCGSCGNVEIPEDVAEDYMIDNYDGIETLHKRVELY